MIRVLTPGLRQGFGGQAGPSPCLPAGRLHGEGGDLQALKHPHPRTTLKASTAGLAPLPAGRQAARRGGRSLRREADDFSKDTLRITEDFIVGKSDYTDTQF